MLEGQTGGPRGRRNRGFCYHETIGPDAGGRTLLDHLVRSYPHSARERWCARIRDGRVLVDASRAVADQRLEPGQRLTWRRPPWREPAAPLAFAVLYRDEHLLAVAKPAGLPTLAGAGFLEHTLAALVSRHDPAARPVHRLGRWTSGLVLFARTARARAELARAWRERAVYKGYRALASGRPERDRFDVERPIGPVPHDRLGSVHAASASGKPAHSRVRVIERRGEAFLADVNITTGRPHQIRIHLALAGHPLVGDPLYAVGGRPAAGCTALPGDPGYLLHATVLSLPHPCGGRLDLRCPAPRLLRRGF